MKTNVIYNKSCEDMSEVEDESVHLIVTSPPYNVGKNYSGNKEDDKRELNEYLSFVKNVLKECYRVLCIGGRIVINIANCGRNPYIPLTTYYTNILMDLSFLHRGIIIWDKGASAKKRTSWGSWNSASNPCLRDVNEFILCFSKRQNGRLDKGESTMEKEEFLCYTESIWKMIATNSKQSGHPAAFPIEFPNRVIKLYSYKNDIVLDPFMGSGTTAIAALKNDRRYIGYELENKFCKLAESRINKLS